MKKIDHTKPYSKDDIAFLRQVGSPTYNEMLLANARQHDYDLDDPNLPSDTVVRQVVGPEAAGERPPPVNPALGAPRLVDPTNPTNEVVVVEEPDDYDKWKVAELEAEIGVRNELPNTSDVDVQGTGADGKVLKGDLVRALRLWDKHNPDAQFPEDEDNQG